MVGSREKDAGGLVVEGSQVIEMDKLRALYKSSGEIELSL